MRILVNTISYFVFNRLGVYLFTTCLAVFPSLAHSIFFETSASCQRFYKIAETEIIHDYSEIVFGENLDYKVRKKTGILFPHSLGIENDLVISFSVNGHTMIWFEGRRIDSDGPPLINVQSFTKQNITLPEGVLFIKKNVSPEFRTRFREYLQAFRSRGALTCVANTCKVLNQLDVSEMHGKRFFKPSSFLRHLIQYYRSLSPEEQKNYAILSSDIPISKHVQEFENNQHAVASMTLIPAGAVVGGAGLLYGLIQFLAK